MVAQEQSKQKFIVQTKDEMKQELERKNAIIYELKAEYERLTAVKDSQSLTQRTNSSPDPFSNNNQDKKSFNNEYDDNGDRSAKDKQTLLVDSLDNKE